MATHDSDDKLDYVDALRGLAVLMVIVYHVGHALTEYGMRVSSVFKGGQYGVQLFFVASAFTLCLSHFRRAGEDQATARFFVRRLFRIAPLYYLGLAVYFLIRGVHEGAWPPARYDLAAVFTNLTFTHGFSPHTINYVVPGGWSIACEMLFYVLLPLILAVVDNSRKAAWLWAGCTAVQLTIGFVTLAPRFDAVRAAEPAFFYFWLPNQLPVFAAGILSYFLLEQLRPKSPAARRRFGQAAWIGCMLVGMVAAGMLLSGRLGRLNHVLMPPVCGVAFGLLLLAAALAPPKVLLNRVLRTFGVYSYGGYIAHFAMIWFLLPPDRSHPGVSPTLILWPLYASAVATLTLGAAAALHYAVEAPGVALGRAFIRRFLSKRSPAPAAAASSADAPASAG